LRSTFWAEAANYSTDIINSICTSINYKSPHTQLFNEDPPYVPFLHPFGEISLLVNNKIKHKAKIMNRGLLGLSLGRAKDHSPETGRFYNLDTQQVVLSRDVKYLDQMYMDYFFTTSCKELPVSSNRFDDDEEGTEETNLETKQVPPIEINSHHMALDQENSDSNETDNDPDETENEEE
jgi:hypothetical protein